MALSATISLDSGVLVSYWKITRINEDFLGNAEVYLGGFISKEARDAGKHALEYRTFNFSARDLTRVGAYNLIKTSKPEVKTISEAVMDGETVVTPAVTETVETNPFADAEDC